MVGPATNVVVAAHISCDLMYIMQEDLTQDPSSLAILHDSVDIQYSLRKTHRIGTYLAFLRGFHVCVCALRRMVWKSICKDSLNLNTCLLESFLRLDLVLREKQAASIETKHMMSPDPLPESFLGVLHLREPKIMVTLLPSVTYASSTSYKCSILFGNM